MLCDSTTHCTGGSKNNKMALIKEIITVSYWLTPGSSANTSEVTKITSAQDNNLMDGIVNSWLAL